MQTFSESVKFLEHILVQVFTALTAQLEYYSHALSCKLTNDTTIHCEYKCINRCAIEDEYLYFV